MRLVDCYIPAILFTRRWVRQFKQDEGSVDELHNHYDALLSDLREQAEALGFSASSIEEAWFAVCAYIDELLLTSQWPERQRWQQRSLQRQHFGTTNAGADFYQRLNRLNKHGEDRSVREVFLLCLGLGFKGQYFDPADRPELESARGFNLSLMLPDEAQHNIDRSTLFQSAYSENQLAAREWKRRISLIPFVIAIPSVLIAGTFLFYASQINNLMTELLRLVN